MEENFCVQIYRQLILVCEPNVSNNSVCVRIHTGIYTYGEEHREFCCYAAVHSELLLKVSSKTETLPPSKEIPTDMGILNPVCPDQPADILSTSMSVFSFSVQLYSKPTRQI